MVVIADAGPLIYLTRLGMRDLLRDLYGTVLIPPAVAFELLEKGSRFPDAPLIREVLGDWLILTVPDPDSASEAADELMKDLGQGEREAITLAKERNELLLCDDHVARTAAAYLGVPVTGTIGVIFAGVERRIIPGQTARSLIDKLAETRFHLSAKDRNRMIRSLDHLLSRLQSEE